MNTTSKYAGWLTLIGGVVSIFLQLWGAMHGSMPDAHTFATAAGVTTAGVAHITTR